MRTSFLILLIRVYFRDLVSEIHYFSPLNGNISTPLRTPIVEGEGAIVLLTPWINTIRVLSAHLGRFLVFALPHGKFKIIPPPFTSEIAVDALGSKHTV